MSYSGASDWKEMKVGMWRETVIGSHTGFMPPVAGDMGPEAVSRPCTERQLPMALVEGSWQGAL